MTPAFRLTFIPLLCAAPLAAQTVGVPAIGAGPPDTSRAGQHTAAVPSPIVVSPVTTAPAAAARRPLPTPAVPPNACTISDITKLGRNPTAGELRCRYHARGPGRFGLLSYLDVPVYQPRTPQPGTHVVGVPGMPHPLPGESYEQWEWRVLKTVYGPGVRAVHREMELLDPVFASKLMQFERELRAHGVHAVRRETWRSEQRQAYIFQQGRSRPGPIATSTLTSWHNRVDRMGRPAARAADYAVSPRDLPAFYQIAQQLGIEGYGADSNDPGHVYLPDTDAASGMEIAVLRLLPRVPHVTLETGRPYDEQPIPGMPTYWRELTGFFLERWTAFPRLELRLSPPPSLRPLRAPKWPPDPPPPPPDTRHRRGRRTDRISRRDAEPQRRNPSAALRLCVQPAVYVSLATWRVWCSMWTATKRIAFTGPTRPK